MGEITKASPDLIKHHTLVLLLCVVSDMQPNHTKFKD